MIKDLQGIITKETTLQMVAKVVNNIGSPNGLVLTLLVFGDYQCIYNIDLLTSTIIQRAAAIKKVIK